MNVMDFLKGISEFPKVLLTFQKNVLLASMKAL